MTHARRRRDASGVRHWVGTVGVAICTTGREYYESPALAVMIGALPADSFRILPFYNRSADTLPGGWDTWLSRSGSHIAVLHGDPANSILPQLLTRLSDELPGGYLVGGLTSSHGSRPQVADEVLDGGLSGVVFNREGIGDDRVQRYCRAEAIPLLCTIPHDRRIAEAYAASAEAAFTSLELLADD